MRLWGQWESEFIQEVVVEGPRSPHLLFEARWVTSRWIFFPRTVY